jgi:alpha-D-xyloside xylohydrolase
MKKMEWCNFTFDPEHFPDPKAYLAKIKKDHGVKVCLWINSYISQQSPLFEEGIKGDFLIKRKNGDIWQWCVFLLSRPHLASSV